MKRTQLSNYLTELWNDMDESILIIRTTEREIKLMCFSDFIIQCFGFSERRISYF